MIIKVEKPLIRFIKLTHGDDGDQVIIPVLYEKLPELCFFCGIFGHGYMECEQCFDGDPGSHPQLPKFKFGTWMRVGGSGDWTRNHRGRK